MYRVCKMNLSFYEDITSHVIFVVYFFSNVSIVLSLCFQLIFVIILLSYGVKFKKNKKKIALKHKEHKMGVANNRVASKMFAKNSSTIQEHFKDFP